MRTSKSRNMETGDSGIRDQSVKKGNAFVYLQWSHEIARIEDGILTLDNCGYATHTTGERLSRIYRELGYPGDLHVGMSGWSPFLAWCPAKLCEPYPLVIDLKTETLISMPDTKVWGERLKRMRCPHKLKAVSERLIAFKLMEAA